MMPTFRCAFCGCEPELIGLDRTEAGMEPMEVHWYTEKKKEIEAREPKE
jgi:hypothetical protein